MPKGVDPNIQKTVDLLPTTGEITYDAWKQKLGDAGLYALTPLTRSAKQVGLVKFRNQVNADGTLTVMVGRV